MVYYGNYITDHAQICQVSELRSFAQTLQCFLWPGQTAMPAAAAASSVAMAVSAGPTRDSISQGRLVSVLCTSVRKGQKSTHVCLNWRIVSGVDRA